jgi:hypothetical protein
MKHLFSHNIFKSSLSGAYLEGFYSRLGNKSGKMEKKPLQENLKQFCKNSSL